MTKRPGAAPNKTRNRHAGTPAADATGPSPRNPRNPRQAFAVAVDPESRSSRLLAPGLVPRPDERLPRRRRRLRLVLMRPQIPLEEHPRPVPRVDLLRRIHALERVRIHPAA